MIFNAPSDEVYSVREAVDVLRELAPTAEITISEHAGRTVDEFPVVDGSRARRELGVVPKYGFRAGVSEMMDHFRATGGSR